MPSDAGRRFACIDSPSFKRSLFGYRRSQVERAVAERDRALGEVGGCLAIAERQIERMETQLRSADETAAARERRIDSLGAELQLARGEAAHSARGLARAGLELEEATVAARARASRLRLDALRDAAGVAARVQAIAGVNPDTAERLLAALERAVERVAAETTSNGASDPGAESGGNGSESGAEGSAPADDAVHHAAEGRSGIAGRSSKTRVAADATAPERRMNNGGRPDRDDRTVSVDIGPFKDFSQLIRFEDAANAIGATEEISIRRFSEGRASIDVSLSEPVDLLRELEQRCDLEFEVRRTSDGEIVLDMGE